MDDRIDIILRGKLGKTLPVQRSQLVRIFTSSTFTDTSVERNALMREIYPRLKDYCKSKHGLEFQVIDMRWGVRDEATDDHMTSELCMREIAACQRVSVGPNFVTFLCQKYGYRPFPPKIPASEFELLRQTLVTNSKSVDVLDEWFLRDDNCIPAIYILQPISSKLPHFNRPDEPEKQKAEKGQWWNVFETIQADLKFAAQACSKEGSMSAEQARKFIISVTHDEVTNGILEAPGNREEHCICFVRKFEDLKNNAAAKSVRNFMDMNGEDIDAEAQELLDDLRDGKIPQALSPNNIHVNMLPEWKEEGVDLTVDGHKTYLAQFLDTFYKTMVSMVDAAVAKVKEEQITNPLHEEILQHLSFCQTKCDGFQGREDVLEKVKGYIDRQAGGGDHGSPLIICGESGSGKTSILAKCASLASSHWLNKQNSATMVRFLGTSPSSASIRRVLRSLCQQIQEVFERENTDEIPEDYLKLVTTFAKLLRVASKEKPLVIFLDSLDQLSSENGAHRMAWLPKILPSYVAIVVSTLPKEHGILDALKSLLPEGTDVVEVLPFSPEAGAEVLDTWLSSNNKAVTSQQRELVHTVVSKCSLPLFLKLVYDEVCRWKSYRSIQQCILHPNIVDMISLIFDRLEDYHGKVLVSRALAYITLSPNGLAESELEDLLSLDDDVLNDVYQWWLPPVRRIPPSLWTRARADINNYLVEREADGVNVIYWYHRQFIETAAKRYLGDAAVKKSLHAKCAEYYQGKWSEGTKKPCRYSERQVKMFSVPAEAKEDRMVAAQPLRFKNVENKENARYNLRKLTQLPFHLTEAEDFDTLNWEVLCNFDFLLGKLKALSIQEVMKDFERAEEMHFDQEADFIGDALRLSASTVAKDPDQLAPELLGRLISLIDEYPKIKLLVERAREVCGQTYPLIPLNTCLQPPGGLLSTSLEGHTDAVVAVQVSGDNRLVVTGSKDNTARVWTLDNGTLLHTLEGHREAVYGIEITPDDQQVMTSSNAGEYMKSGKICVWNLETGDQVHRLKGHTGKYRCNVALSQDGKYAVSGFELGNNSENEDTDYEDDIKDVRDKSMKKKKRKVKITRYDEEDEDEDQDEEDEDRDDDEELNVVAVWSVETGELLHWMLGHEDEIKGVLPIEEGGQQVALSYSQDHTMIFWDMAKGDPIRRVEDHNTFPIWVVQMSHDKKFLAEHGSDCSITRPDGKHLFDLQDEESSSTVNCFQFFPDNTRVAAGHCSGEVKIYGLGAGGFDQKMITKVKCDDDTNSVLDLLITPDNKYIVAATHQEAAFVFTTDTLTLVTKLPHITTVDKLAMTVDGSRILTASEDKNVRVWDTTKIGKESVTGHIDKHDDTVTTVTFLHHKNEVITTAYQIPEFKVWDIQSGKLLRSSPIPDDMSCHEVAITGDDGRLVGAGGYQWYVLRLPELTLLNKYQERMVHPSHFALTPDDSRLVAGIGQPEHSIRIYDLSTGQTLQKMNLRSTDITMLPDGNFVNQYYQQMYDSTGMTRVIQLINGYTGQLVEEFKHGDRVLDYAVSSDHTMLVCGCADKDIDLWHLKSRSRMGRLKGHTGRVLSVCFSPDNTKLASGADDGEAFLWSVGTKEILHSLKGHKSDISSMVFSKDGKYLFTAAENELYIMVWSVENGSRMMTYSTYSVVRYMRISNLSNHVVVGLQDGRVFILQVNDFTLAPMESSGVKEVPRKRGQVKASTPAVAGAKQNKSPRKTNGNNAESGQGKRKPKSSLCLLV